MKKNSPITVLCRLCSAAAVAALFAGVAASAKIREIGTPLSIRPITIKNVAYSADGRIFAVPNFVSAGSVALFWVSQEGQIARMPARFSEKSFVRSSGLFFLRRDRETEPHMAFAALPELLTGYAVDFSESGLQLVIAGGTAAIVYDGADNWNITRTLTIGTSVSRAVFSPDGSKLAVIADGKIYLFSTAAYTLITTIDPVAGNRFCDAVFANDNSVIAACEFRPTLLDYGMRVRVYRSSDGMSDRDLPYLPFKPSSEPGSHLPLLSYSPGDSLLAVTIPTSFTGKILLIKSNDGTPMREFKGFCHAFSPDGTLFAADNKVYATRDWSVLGTLPRSSVACAFSPTERAILVVTQESIRRFRIEE
jgi:hypothetical protein